MTGALFLFMSFLSLIWWPRTAIRNFFDYSRKFNFCNLLILKLLHFFYEENIKDLFFIKHNVFLKRLNLLDF